MAYVKGFEEVRKNLQDLEKNWIRAAARRVLRSTMKWFLVQMKGVIPSITGHLRSSFKVKAGKNRAHSVTINVLATKADGGKWYASFFEWRKKNKKPKRMSNEFKADFSELEQGIILGFKEELSRYEKPF